MQSVSMTLLNFSKPSDQDYVNIQYGVLFDTGDYAQFSIAGSDDVLTANAQANGKPTWDEQDISDVYGLTLSDGTVAKLTENATKFQAAIQAGTVTLGVSSKGVTPL